MALTQTLVDPFASTSLDTSKWTSFGTVTTPGATLNCASQPGTTNYSGLNSNDSIMDLTGSYAYSEIVTAGTQSVATWQVIAVAVVKDANNAVNFYVESSLLNAQKQVGGVFSTVRGDTLYDTVQHKFLRIRESGGTTFFDYSSDRMQWKNYTSLANPFAVTSVRVDVKAGYYTTQSASIVAKFDNFNVGSSAMMTLLGVGV